MKKLFSFLFIMLLFVACGDDEEVIEDLLLSSSTPKSQTLKSYDRSTPTGITFTATQDWRAKVKDISSKGVAPCEWLQLSQYEGGAGTTTLYVSVAMNDSETNRFAEIQLLCGASIVTLKVAQTSAANDDKANPEFPNVNPEQAYSKVKTIQMYKTAALYMPHPGEEYLMRKMQFSYDEKGNISHLKVEDYEGILIENNDPASKPVEKWATSQGDYTVSYLTQKSGAPLIRITGNISETSNHICGDGSLRLIESTSNEDLLCDKAGKVVKDNLTKKYNDDDFGNSSFQGTYRYDAKGHRIQSGDDYFFSWENNNISRFSSTGQTQDGKGSITYNTDVENQANIDLSHAVALSVAYDFPYDIDDLEISEFVGRFGKRNLYLPACVKTASEGIEGTFQYQYKMDGGEISEIICTRSGYISNYDGPITYRFTIEYVK